MMRQNNFSYLITAVFLFFLLSLNSYSQPVKGLKIGKGGYFEMPGLNVLVYNNTFPEGHQGGVEIIQHDNRVATNGELRLSPSPGQWQPIPKLGVGYEARGVSPQEVALISREIDTLNNMISMPCSYPDSSRSRISFNPIIYPDLELSYKVTVKANGASFKIIVDLDQPIPDEWVGRIGYNIELFPGDLYGKTYMMDGKSGIFARQAAGPTYLSKDNEVEALPFAKGNRLVIAPENDLQRMLISSNTELLLLDGSLKHNNGWFTVRSLIPAGKTKGAIEWEITPNVIPGWKRGPIVHISQVGYHPAQKKTAFVELDLNDNELLNISLVKILEDGSSEIIKEEKPVSWGQFLRYNYFTMDFEEIEEEGIYRIKYGDFVTNPFQISTEVYQHNVWHPTLEYFIPIQMCHMRVNQRYRVWHGACHLDDALIAPLNIRHFDGYNNENETSTLSNFKPLEHAPGLNVGGWHDAGDYDLRVESQAITVMALAYAYEEFGIEYDETYVDQLNRHVELHMPDGKPDILQQVEHGVLTILAGYNQFGRLYRGIIAPSLRQYVHLGDALTHTDNKIFDNDELRAKASRIDELWYKKVANLYSNKFDPGLNHHETELFIPELDDRLVFNSSDGYFQLVGASGLAAASRVLKKYHPALSAECIRVAEEIWSEYKRSEGRRAATQKISTLVELILSTGKEEYKDELKGMTSEISQGFRWIGWSVGRVLGLINNEEFTKSVTESAEEYKPELDKVMQKSPFHSPLENTEYIAFAQYYLQKAWPSIFSPEYLYSVVNYLLGCRPGNTTNSLVSGVGVNSPTIAYGTNRADWSYIPGGTFWNAVNLVHPDYAEDKVWPYLWQEREYIITAPAYYMFAVIATDRLLSGNK